jgi:hypothetical protein
MHDIHDGRSYFLDEAEQHLNLCHSGSRKRCYMYPGFWTRAEFTASSVGGSGKRSLYDGKACPAKESPPLYGQR